MVKIENYDAILKPNYEITKRYLEVPEEVFPPDEAYRYFPPLDEVILTTGTFFQRLIFEGGQEFEDYELEHIRTFEDFIEEQKIELSDELKEVCSKQNILRFMQATSFKVKDCLHAFENYVEWKKINVPPILTELTSRMIDSGYFYIHGRDRKFRPMIIINPRKIRQFKDLGLSDDTAVEEVIRGCSFIIEYVVKNIHLPGQIENWILICDVAKLGITEIPVKMVGKVIGCLSDNYRCKSRRMFILNTTYGLKLAWSVIQTFMKTHTKKKISLTNENTDKELFEFAHPDQVEEKYGGNAPDAEVFWPPVMPSTNFDHDENLLVSEKEYLEILKNNKDLKPRPDLINVEENNITPNTSVSNKNVYHDGRVNVKGGDRDEFMNSQESDGIANNITRNNVVLHASRRTRGLKGLENKKELPRPKNCVLDNRINRLSNISDFDIPDPLDEAEEQEPAQSTINKPNNKNTKVESTNGRCRKGKRKACCSCTIF